MEASLTPPITLNANPAAYDYIHAVRLLTSNLIEMVAGDGQKMHFRAVGRFHMVQQSDAVIFSIFQIARIDPYDHSTLNLEAKDFECTALIEYGNYFLPDELPNASVPDKQQFLSFDRRLVFDVDPIVMAERESDSPTTSIFDASERIYYVAGECRRGTRAQLTRPRLILPETF